jgi:hypothetical protein
MEFNLPLMILKRAGFHPTTLMVTVKALGSNTIKNKR